MEGSKGWEEAQCRPRTDGSKEEINKANEEQDLARAANFLMNIQVLSLRKQIHPGLFRVTAFIPNRQTTLDKTRDRIQRPAYI